MKNFEGAHSGESGAQNQETIHLLPASTVDLPDVPAVPQRVKFFTARNTFIAESSLETMPAIKFDAFIAPLFKDIQGIDREKWELADRIHAINTALSQQEQRRENGQVYLRLDLLPDSRLLLTVVQPEERIQNP